MGLGSLVLCEFLNGNFNKILTKKNLVVPNNALTFVW